MTSPAAIVAPTSLELQAAQLGARYSRTSAEREQIAEDVHALLTAYEAQGGRSSIQWLRRHMGVSHGSAWNLRDAGRAIKEGAPRGSGVSHLALIGRYLRQGKSLQDALSTAADAQKRQEAAQEAQIGVGKVKFPTNLTDEMADGYNTLARTYQQAGLTPPPLEEMTVTMTRLAVSELTPQKLRAVELGEAIGTGKVEESSTNPPSFYSWLAAQTCACCGDSGVQLHHLLVPQLTDSEAGRRHHDHKELELLIPLCPRHHGHARDAAHGSRQNEWAAYWFKHPQGAIIRAARYVSEYMQAHGLLRGK